MPKETVPTDKERSRNRLVAVPNVDQPYFGNAVDIPQTAGLEPVMVNIKLKRGLWITGRVTDEATGKAVASRVEYFPYASNPHINQDEWRNQGSRTSDESRHVTQEDGTFRILGLPGRGIVGATALSLAYRPGVGAAEIPGMDKDGHFPTLGDPMPADSHRQHALKEINPTEGSQSVTCDFALEAGGHVRLVVVDNSGKPVDNTYLLYSSDVGLTISRELASSFEIAGLMPKETRRYLISQGQRKVAKLFRLEYNGDPSKPLTITLEPTATVRGRLVDEDGSPVKNIRVRPTAKQNGKYFLDLFPFEALTDSDGRFSCENLAAGCESYDLWAHRPGNGNATVAEKVKIVPGKTIDLGELKFRPKE